MRAFATMLAAAAGYASLVIGTLLVISTAYSKPPVQLIAELGPTTVLAVEMPTTFVADCSPTTIS